MSISSSERGFPSSQSRKNGAYRLGPSASAFAAGLTGRVPFGREATVFNRGGLVRASATAPADGALVTISGNASFVYDAAIQVDGGRAAALEIVARREAESTAWEAALASIA